MPVILATWKAKTRKTAVWANLGKKFARPHLNQKLSTVAHACHPELCEWLRSRGSWSQVRPGKSLQNPHLNGKMLSAMAHSCHSSYCGKHKIQVCPVPLCPDSSDSSSYIRLRAFFLRRGRENWDECSQRLCALHNSSRAKKEKV
jgi:hypothetical protein